MKRNFLIVEDEVFISEHLKQLIVKCGHQVTKICSTEKSAFEAIAGSPPDFAFLDIRLIGSNSGINIGKKLHELAIPFMYITSFVDKATIQEAVDTQPMGYLVKPFTNDEIIQAIQKFVQLETDCIHIKTGNETQRLNPDNIVFAQSDSNYVELHLTSGKHLARIKLAEIIEQINRSDFIQVHRSFAVNLQHVKAFSSKHLQVGDHKIPVSKSYMQLIQDLLH